MLIWKLLSLLLTVDLTQIDKIKFIQMGWFENWSISKISNWILYFLIDWIESVIGITFNRCDRFEKKVDFA